MLEVNVKLNKKDEDEEDVDESPSVQPVFVFPDEGTRKIGFNPNFSPTMDFDIL